MQEYYARIYNSSVSIGPDGVMYRTQMLTVQYGPTGCEWTGPESETCTGPIRVVNSYVQVAVGQVSTSGNSFCSSAACMGVLAWSSNFTAGAGDVLSFGTTYLARKYIFDSDKVVDMGSGAYISGAVTGAVIGAALGKEIAARPNTTQIKFAVHEAHHTFGSLGKLAHIQMNVWKAGVSGSGWALRIPLPW